MSVWVNEVNQEGVFHHLLSGFSILVITSKINFIKFESLRYAFKVNILLRYIPN